MIEKVGQQLIIGLQGPTLLPEEKEFLLKYNIGGVILFDRNLQSPEQLHALTSELHSLRKQSKDKSPLIISIDMEGGRVLRLKEPFTKLMTNITSINIGEAFNYFTSLQKFAPIAKNINGLFNANIDMSSILNEKMQPNYNSMNVTGDIQLTDAVVKGLDILNQMGSLLKVDWLQ